MNREKDRFVRELFGSSVLKQAKYREIVRLLGPTEGRTCLDIGGDNGIVSYLLRQRGGDWASADLDPNTVASIRNLVESEVYQIDGRGTPFADNTFDQVVIIDFLEHIHTDRKFVCELARILKPGGRLIVNVPHLKPASLLNRFRHAIGQTDEKHGHVRPGYSLPGLRSLLEPRFTVTSARTYSGSFSEALDTALTWAYERLGQRAGQKDEASQKGTVVTQADMGRQKKAFRALRLVYPLLWLFARLDHVLVLQSGYKLIVLAEAAGEEPAAGWHPDGVQA
jgi:SAM-dependent methyltransferase